MQPLKDEEKNAEWLGLTQPGEQKSKAGKTRQSFAPRTENGSTPPWISMEKLSQEAAVDVLRAQEIWDVLLFGGEDFSPSPWRIWDHCTNQTLHSRDVLLILFSLHQSPSPMSSSGIPK